ncbi:Hypothetical predicted protein [Lecanosticta acicola]|uniref:Uncharacterized protein n=1 Tax=Lecanosticta acicola TaxID=111012 RepID=A0AAI9E710_9PEZI|nr:Hypothetical predicted protein [Lecanosticta acicola]
MPFFDPETIGNVSSLNMDEYRFIYNPPDSTPRLPREWTRGWLRRPRFQLGLILLVLVVLTTITPLGPRVTSIYDSLIDEFVTTIRDEFAKIPEVVVPPGVSVVEQAQLQKVADQMLLLYRTLVDLRYIDPRGVQYGPHRVDVEAGLDLGIDPRVIYLHQILPTVDPVEAGERRFLFGGDFSGATFRQPQRMTLDLGNLTLPGSHRSPNDTSIARLSDSPDGAPVMIYDTETDHMWILVRTPRESPESASILFNQGKPAVEALDSIDHMLRRLDIIPGVSGSSRDPTFEYKAVKYLYEATHWYGAFDGDSFEASRDILYASAHEY